MDSVGSIHKVIGYAIPSGFALLALWSVYSLVRNRDPHPWFWSLLGILQAIIGIQFVVGGSLYISGLRPASNGPEWLHYVYGALFPAAVLIFAHRWAKGSKAAPWLVFGVAALICFGLTFRALQTGLGVD
jgi:hypothetical protein